MKRLIALLLITLFVAGCSAHAVKRDRYLQIGMDCALVGVIASLKHTDKEAAKKALNKSTDLCIHRELAKMGEE